MNQSCFVAKIHAVGDSEANFWWLFFFVPWHKVK